MQYLDIRVVGEKEEINELLIILRKIQWCGSVGAGRTIPIYVDGDGSGRLSFGLKINDKIKPIEKHVILDEEKMTKVSDGDDFETHWIGE